MNRTLIFVRALILTSLLSYDLTTVWADDIKITQFENALGFSIQLKGIEVKKFNILERMKRYAVPGVSVAMIDQGEIVWAKAWGVKNLENKSALTPKNLFQAASISKPIAAFGAMRLVDQRKLSLDAPINNVLKQWQIPENDFTKKVPVTLRHLLSHSAGMTVHGFAGYSLDQPYPDILSVLNGKAPANSGAIEVDTLPGSIWRYSGGGYTVVQIAMEDASGVGFVKLMDTLVLKPVGMTNSSYSQPLPVERRGEAVTAYSSGLKPIDHQFHAYPELAAAGLWTTPTDLGKFALFISKTWKGEKGALLSPDLANDFLSIQKNNWGLGFELVQEDGRVIGFSHDGSNAGFRNNLIALLDGRGVVIMTNSDTGDALYREILVAAASVYDWPIHRPVEKVWSAISDELSKKISGVYRLIAGEQVIDITVKHDIEGIVIGIPQLLSTEKYFLEKEDNGIAYFFNQAGVNVSFTKIKAKYLELQMFGMKAVKQ